MSERRAGTPEPERDQKPRDREAAERNEQRDDGFGRIRGDEAPRVGGTQTLSFVTGASNPLELPLRLTRGGAFPTALNRHGAPCELVARTLPGSLLILDLAARSGSKQMALILLILFPVLLMYRPRAAFVAIALAIVLLYRQRTSAARRKARRRIDDDA